MLWNSARKTTRSASDFPITAVPYRETHTVKYIIINNSLKLSWHFKKAFVFAFAIARDKAF